MATKFNVSLVFYGENQAEYGNKISENKKSTMDTKFFSTKSLGDIVLGGLRVKEIMEKYNFKINDFEPYIPVSQSEIEKNSIEQQFLGYYKKWDPQEAYYYATENTGFSANDERTEGTYSKYSSIDDKIDTFHYYTTLIKFGIGRTTYDTAQEIRTNKITREEGIALIKKFDHEFPKKYFKEFLDYIDISENVFWEKINEFRSPHLWEKKNGEWVLKKTIF